MPPPLDEPTVDALARLRHATEAVLDPATPVHALRTHVLALAAVLDAAGTATPDLATDETWTPSGLALSPTLAASCVEDYVRTVRFLRGLRGAIDAAGHRAPERPVRVLYAGCGPHAPLAVPLLAVLPPGAARFTLLDIHAASVASARAVLDTLGLAGAVDAVVTGDAGAYTVDPAAPPDVIVLEIMQRELEAEPQVPVTRHLLAQAPDALLVPDLVQIDLVLVDPAAEFGARGPDGEPPQPRQFVGTVFALNRAAVAAWGDGPRDTLPAATLRLPRRVDPRLEPWLFTTIRTFGDEVLRIYESGLTIPRGLTLPGPVDWGGRVGFTYRLGPRPHLHAEALAPGALAVLGRRARRWLGR